MATGELPADLPARHFTAPDIAPVFGDLPSGGFYPRFIVCTAQVYDPQPRFMWHLPRSEGCPHGVLLFTKVSDDANLESARRGLPRAWKRRRGLMNDAKLGAERFRDRPMDQIVQADQPIGALHGRMGLRRMAVLKAVDVGARQQDDQRPVGMHVGKAPDGIGTPPRMHRDHHVGVAAIVGLGNSDEVTQGVQHAGPSYGCNPVATPRLFSSRRNKANLHCESVSGGKMTACVSAPVASEQLITMMRSARQRTLELIDGLTPEQLIGPKLPTVNPLLWEIGHVAWFHEYFILRSEHSYAPLLSRGDDLYDSIAIAHDRRWELPLYTLAEIKAYMGQVCDALFERLASGAPSVRDSYLYQFTTFHEDMHCEAYTWTRQALAYPTPHFATDGLSAVYEPGSGPLPGDAHLPGGTFPVGSPRGTSFVFDNEKWAHDVTIAPFSMALAPVTNEQFAAFVEAGGYRHRESWCEDGWRWRSGAGATHPVYWKRNGTKGWLVRRFNDWHPLPPHQPAIHVNWYEAAAWCRWAGRRLPTEAEWEYAARWRPDRNGGLTRVSYPWGNASPEPHHANLDGYALGCVDVAAHGDGDNAWGCRQLLGNVWEWTAEDFGPFPGFTPDDYKEYSEPLFGNTKVLRGGAWTTRSRMISSAYRNYFPPDRRDIFAGFRTCTLG